MKTAVSLPDPLFKRAETEAKRRGISRSKLHQLALEKFLTEEQSEEITAAINRAADRDGELTTEDRTWIDHSLQTIWESIKDDKWGK